MSHPKLLVVDDNSTTRKMFRIVLEAEGYAVVEADTGERALAALADPSIGLVLLDCRLPDMEGPEVARKIRDLAPSIPVIAVTGWAQADEAAMLAAGFVEVLVKPVAPARLVEVVQYHLGNVPASLVDRGKRALVIDDDAAQRKLVRLALMNAGFEAVTAEDGEAALALAREAPPDIVLSDVLMPKMDGFEVCRAFRADPVLAKIPIVLMSAHYLEDADRELGARFGASRYVSRADGLDRLMREVVASLESKPERLTSPPPWNLREQYMQRVAHQLERQAALSTGFARRASLQATAMSVLGSISEALARQKDPEAALDETLAQCLDAAGLSVGAIMLFGEEHRLIVRASVGGVSDSIWTGHADLFEKALDPGVLLIPSEASGPRGESLLAAAHIATALAVPIVARDEAFGILVLGSSHRDFAGPDGESFVKAVHAVSTQLGQALALSRLFSRLVAAEERYRVLFDNARDTISILSPEGVILETNKRCEEVMGISRSEIIGRHIVEFSPQERATASVAMYTDTVAKGGGSILSTPILRADGTLFHLEFSSSVVEVGGQKLVLVIGRDVTDRQRLADQLRHAQKLEAVGRLAGGVAHDMNNVLGVVLTYADLLQTGLSEVDPRREDAAEIQKAAERGAGLTRQLLAFSRQQVIKPRVVQLNDVIKGLSKMLQTLIGEDVKLVVLLADDLPTVHVDPGSFEQVIMNLAVNARDAMPQGGQLTIRTQVGRGAVLVTVTDTGSGMDANILQHVFEPFFTTKEIGKGTGLGLATVFGIVKQARGEIEVDSALGRGTTFSIYFPSVADAKPADGQRRVEKPAPAGDETIVVVEDESALRNALVRALRTLGYQVISEPTVARTLGACAEHKGEIRLLVSDVVLPTLSGPEVARKLLQEHAQMKVLFMSGYTDTSAYPDVPLGGRSFLQKPFTPQTLATRVRELLDATD